MGGIFMGDNRREGSTLAGVVVGLILIIYGVASFCLGRDPLAMVPPAWIVGGSAILFGAVLLAWAGSVKTKFIGNPTVNMLTGVIAAVVAISALVRSH